MYDSPIAWCPIARIYVALDESQPECQARHQCGSGDCPLAARFCGAVQAPALERQDLPHPTLTLLAWFGS